MSYELSKTFVFDAAHTLDYTAEPETTRRIHGHSYWAEVTVRGAPDPATGMVIDFFTFEKLLNKVRDSLDHQYLDDIPGLKPATLENLCAWIWKRLQPELPNLFKVAILRKSTGHRCVYHGPRGQ